VAAFFLTWGDLIIVCIPHASSFFAWFSRSSYWELLGKLQHLSLPTRIPWEFISTTYLTIAGQCLSIQDSLPPDTHSQNSQARRHFMVIKGAQEKMRSWPEPVTSTVCFVISLLHIICRYTGTQLYTWFWPILYNIKSFALQQEHR